jgi:hypothetical protein
MDRVISNALRRRAELRTQLKEIDKFLELYEEFKVPGDPAQPTFQIHYRGEGLPEQSESESEQAGEMKADEMTPSQETEEGEDGVPGLTRAALLPHIKATILEAQRPLTRGQLLQKLDMKGVRVGGKADRSKNMGTIMWRLREHFVNLQGFGYWLRDRPFPLAGYDPEDLNSPEAIDYILRESPPEDDG